MRRGLRRGIRHLVARDVVASRDALDEELLLDVSLLRQVQRRRVEGIAVRGVAQRACQRHGARDGDRRRRRKAAGRRRSRPQHAGEPGDEHEVRRWRHEATFYKRNSTRRPCCRFPCRRPSVDTRTADACAPPGHRRRGTRESAWARLGFHPAIDGGHHVERAGAVAAAAVAHARHHERAHRLVDGLLVRRRREHALVVVDGVLRRNARVAPAVIDEQLAAVRDELREIRVNGVEPRRGLVGQRDVAVEVQLLRIPLLVLEDDVLEEVRRRSRPAARPPTAPTRARCPAAGPDKAARAFADSTRRRRSFAPPPPAAPSDSPDRHRPLHCVTFGSNLHCVGFSSTPSFTPSSASQASSTALWST